jgi:hypothetical protein
MRIVKLGIISIIVFSLLLVAFSLLIPSHVRISRAVNITAPRQTVYANVESQDKWKEWNELANEKIDVSILSRQPDLIQTAWKYSDKSVNSSFRFEESANITVVQWYFDFHLRWYPWEKFGSITFDKQFGPVMERSLNNLKKLVENSP